MSAKKVGEHKPVVISLRMSRQLAEDLGELAERDGKPRTALMRRVLARHVATMRAEHL